MQRGDYISKDGGILVTADVVNLCTLLFGASYRLFSADTAILCIRALGVDCGLGFT